MKKKAIYSALIMLFILITAASLATAENDKRCSKTFSEITDGRLTEQAIIPSSVKIIEDEAFEGTALIKVELPGKVLSIGDRAFAGIYSLREIKVPLATKYIASTAFDGSERITITAPANSYARTFARSRGLPFSPIVMFCASTQIPLISVFCIDRSTEIIETKTTAFNPETQWQRIEEIKITRTEELIANHVQGRSPPMA